MINTRIFMGFFNGNYIAGFFNNANNSLVSFRVSTNSANRAFGKIESSFTKLQPGFKFFKRPYQVINSFRVTF